MVRDLRAFLEEWEGKHPEDVLRIDKEVKAKWEVSALRSKLEKAGKYPVIICEKPVTVQGRRSQYRLVTNLTASRRRCAAALGAEPGRIAAEWTKKLRVKSECKIISKNEAPVKAVVEKGDEVDLEKFPVLWQYEMDPGPYITAGYVTTYDPDTGTDNCAIQRLWLKAKNKTGYYAMQGQHNWNNVVKFWSSGQDAPVAVWIGHHPAALITANMKMEYPKSHYSIMGSFLNEPLRLVPSELYGESLMVPADAEIVFEGVVPKDLYEAEGPFGEYTGYTGPQRPSWVIQVKCVTHRKDAMYHDIATGTPDHLLLGGFSIEARVYDVVKGVVPELMNVHVPISACCRFHAYLQVKKTRPGIGKDAISAAFACDFRIKHVFVFDEDIDIFNEKEVLWAVATRSQWNRDLVMLVGGTASALDPSHGLPFGCRAGIDCTMPPPLTPGLPPVFPVKNRVPEEVAEKVKLEDFVKTGDLERVPTE